MSAAPSLRQRIQARGYALNVYCQIPSPFIAEVLAREGFDAVTLDLQHGLIGYQDAVTMLTALAGSDVVPMVRTPALDPALVMKMLDAGALGITCAAIDDAEQAASLVRACRYPPLGQRSFGPVRASVLHADYAARANDMTSVLAMVESAAAVRNLEAIIATPGIDGVYIGPLDLAFSMGVVPRDFSSLGESVEQAIAYVLRTCRERKLLVGMLAPNGAAAATLIRRGFQFVTLASDLAALRAQARAWRGEFERAIDASKP